MLAKWILSRLWKYLISANRSVTSNSDKRFQKWVLFNQHRLKRGPQTQLLTIQLNFKLSCVEFTMITTFMRQFSKSVTRHGVIVNRDRLQSIARIWVIAIDWTDQKWHVIVIDCIANLIVIDDDFRDSTGKSSRYITVRWTAVVFEFPPLSSFLGLCFRGGH